MLGYTIKTIQDLEKPYKDQNTLLSNIFSNNNINSNNFFWINLRGTADGVSNFTRLYDVGRISDSIIKIHKIKFDYFAGVDMVRDAAYDDTIFTVDANTRYSMIRTGVKFDPLYLFEDLAANRFNLYVNNNDTRFFPSQYQTPITELDNINLVIGSRVQSIDFKANMTFQIEPDTPTFDNSAIMLVSILVEVLNPQTQNQFIELEDFDTE